MISLLRVTSFILGIILSVSLAGLNLLFAISSGGPPPPEIGYSFLLPFLAAGFVCGIGPILIGLPKLVVGSKKPKMRIFAGFCMLLSMAGTFLFYGVIEFVLPIEIVEIALFLIFIWPAKHFSSNKLLNAGAPVR